MAQPESAGGESVSEESAQESTNAGQVRLERLYLKDASFESPSSPAIFTTSWEPQVELEINNRSQKVGESHYEVVLSVTATAKQQDKTAFIVEVQQAAIFAISGLADDVVHRVMGTVCPNTLFPYVREAVDSLVVRGGFPALHLAPVNFDAAYADSVKKRREQAH